MSADNYYEVRKHPKGGFTYVMGFDSDTRGAREATENDPQFDTAWAAWKAADADGWTEYGISFHVECEDALRWEAGPSYTPF